MSRIYGRKYDVLSVSKKLSDSQLPKYTKDKRKISFNQMIEAKDSIESFLSPKAIHILENSQIKISRNVLNVTPLILPANSMGKKPELIIPTYSPIEENKIDFVHFLGDILTSSKNKMKEYGLLLPFILEYVYLKETTPDALDRFEKRNLSELVKKAKSFMNGYQKYEKDPYRYDLLDYESFILESMRNFSSFDATLQLIELYDENKEEVKQLIDEMITKDKKASEVLTDANIYTYGYKSLKKSIMRQSKR